MIRHEYASRLHTNASCNPREVKEMKKYECLYVIDAALEESVIAETVAKFSELVKANAEQVSVDNWGKKKLAYEVDKKWEGYYSLITFEGPADFIKELERVLRIDERVMKFLVTKIDEKKVAIAAQFAEKRREREAARNARFEAERAAREAAAAEAAPVVVSTETEQEIE